MRTDLFDCFIWSIDNSDISFRFADVCGGMVTSNEIGEIKLTMANSTFARTTFSDLQFLSTSSIESTAFAECEFDNIDMSKLKTFKATSLEMITADARTLHPQIISRPDSWPSYERE